MKKFVLICAACLLALAGCTPRQSAESTPPVQPVSTPTPAVTPLVADTAEPVPTATPAPVETTAVPAETLAPSTPIETPVTEPTQPLPTESVQPEGWDGDPDKLTLADFPTQLANGPELSAGTKPLYLIAQLPDSDTWLYGMGGTDTGIILRVGENWKYFDVRYLTPRMILPQMYYGDFDGDMDLELAVLTYSDSGTGVSIWTLSIVEFGDTGWSILTFQDTDYKAILEQSVLCSYDAATNVVTLQLGEQTLPVDLTALGYDAPTGPVESYVGQIVSFQVEGDTITGRFAVGVHAPNIGYTLFYPAEIHANVLYTGTSFGLGDLTLTTYTAE